MNFQNTIEWLRSTSADRGHQTRTVVNETTGTQFIIPTPRLVNEWRVVGGAQSPTGIEIYERRACGESYEQRTRKNF